ncbi:MAG: carboxypeptidase-like regulatory domain-containing protein [Gemmatimonadota bacterium]|nr:carboxypeptidase-like regulatory domain-containing protein [Gemmatimonadota bacterium]
MRSRRVTPLALVLLLLGGAVVGALFYLQDTRTTLVPPSWDWESTSPTDSDPVGSDQQRGSGPLVFDRPGSELVDSTADNQPARSTDETLDTNPVSANPDSPTNTVSVPGDAGALSALVQRAAVEGVYARLDLRRALLTQAVADFGEEIEFVASVHGRVVDRGGVGIAGADVYATVSENLASNLMVGRVVFAAFDSGPKVATSDGAGYFTYEVRRKANSNSTMSVKLSANAHGYAASEATSVELKNGEAMHGVTLQLPGAGSVTGRVVDEDGYPVVGAVVNVVSNAAFDVRFVSAIVNLDQRTNGLVKTDTGGFFTLENVPEGKQKLDVSAPGYQFIGGVAEVDIEHGRETKLENALVLRRFISLKLTLTDGAGKPLSGLVRFSYPARVGADTTEVHGVLDEKGSGTFTGFRADNYEVTISCEGFKPAKVTAYFRNGQHTDIGTVVLYSNP